ncbi:hypothetical protein PS850_03556 [Pseudomonas fluorescens]|nr:hypothetical protein PS850_03556 [Pseudomonas fluorescens]
MVVLLLAASALTFFTREEPRLPVQIDIFPFGLQQLANPAQRTQADPERELGFFSQRPNAVGFLPVIFWKPLCSSNSSAGEMIRLLSAS